jgi:hypothetical protein
MLTVYDSSTIVRYANIPTEDLFTEESNMEGINLG